MRLASVSKRSIKHFLPNTMKKIKSLSIITLFLTSIVSPLQAMSLFKSMLIATCAITMTNGGVTPQPDNADNLATTLESNFLLTDNYNNPSTLRVKERIPGPSYVRNNKRFTYAIPVDQHFEGEEITLSMVVDGEEATKELPSWLTFDKETYGVYTLFGTPDYNPFFDYRMEYVDYRVVATDIHGKQVSQAFTLHIKGVEEGRFWGFCILITFLGVTFTGASICMSFIPELAVKASLLAADYEKAERKRWCFFNRGTCGFLYIRAKQFEEIKKEVEKLELLAIRLVNQEAKEIIFDVQKFTKIPVERLIKMQKMLKNMKFPQEKAATELLEIFKSLEENKTDTSEEDGMPLTIEMK